MMHQLGPALSVAYGVHGAYLGSIEVRTPYSPSAPGARMSLPRIAIVGAGLGGLVGPERGSGA
jgi:hypothetical protein